MFVPNLEVTLQYQCYVKKDDGTFRLKADIIVLPSGFYLYHECGIPLQPMAERYRRMLLPYRRTQEMSVGWVCSDDIYESYCVDEDE